MRRVAVLIDGSNFIGSLYRADLGYPALAPLIAYLAGGDDLSFARFYGAPPPREPWLHRWRMFVAANRCVRGLDFFQGYRHASSGEEKAVDVALATDLLYGKIANHFDRVAVIGGDGDYVYALKVAKTIVSVRVYLIERSAKGLANARVPYTVLEPGRLIAAGICDPRAGSPVPAAHRAPADAAEEAAILRGSSGSPSYRRLSGS
jgi:NYN domain-containing protein